MTAPTVSVVVASRDRPDCLCRCIRGLVQLDYPAFEIVVAADPPGLSALSAAGFDRGLKTVAVEEPGIGAARNAGIARAAGEIVAFIDDDAVPEPSWLTHLTEPFASPSVSAAGGFVRGRDGVKFQWRGRLVDVTGRTVDVPDWGDAPRVFAPRPDGCAKTEGTNMAVRRDVLARIGGFDPGFRFYLDDTDLNLRLAASGHATALVPLAQVHHGFAASPRRRADRLPLDLFENGASLSLFLRKHAPDRVQPVIDATREAERRRLLRYLVTGQAEPRDVPRVLATFDAGVIEGLLRPLSVRGVMAPSIERFLRWAPRFHGARILAGRSWQASRLRAEAASAVASGNRVKVFLSSPLARRSSVRFSSGGWWEQVGGRFPYGRFPASPHCFAPGGRMSRTVSSQDVS